MKTPSLLLLFLAPALLPAQTWLYEAPVTPKGGGYQDIMLPAAITARLDGQGDNMRLLDSADREVPFVLTQDPLELEETSIHWMSHYRDDYWERWYSRSFFQNPQGLALDRIVLKIRNADVHQSFWLSGSDDMSHWYIIKDNYDYAANYDPQATWNLMTIHFPPTDYKYYKVELRHHWHEPIQIMAAGYYTSAARKGDARNIPEPTISQTEEGKTSIVELGFDAAHYFDEMLFEVDGPERYLRQATLEQRNASGNWTVVKHFALSSKALNAVELEHLRGQSWRLLIDNKDDQPIRIVGLQARQRQLTLTAKLEPAAGYRLAIGEEGLRAPEYDLSYFKNELPKARSLASVGELRDLRKPAEPVASAVAPASPDKAVTDTHVEPEKPLHQQTWFLWAGILVVVVLVGGMSLRLLKDVKREG